MKKTVIIIVSLLTFAVVFSQTPNPKQKMTAQDSAAALQKEAVQFVDSIIATTSIKTMRDFLQGAVTFKEYNEASFVAMYDFYIRVRLDAWMKERASKKPPK